MIQNRYFFYAIMINMVANIMLFVPHFLLEQQFYGALSSILVSIPIGMLLVVVFTKSIAKFPGQSFPNILKKRWPRWATIPFIVYLGAFWFIYGGVTLLAFADITKRYLTPESSIYLILGFYATLVLSTIAMKTSDLLRALEILFVVSAPTVFLVLVETMFERGGDWIGAFDVTTHLLHLPTYPLVASASYVLTGYTNLVIFNEGFRHKLKKRHFLLVGCFALLTLLTSFFLPIIRLGESAVGNYTIPWIATADSVTLTYFVIERLGVPFLLLYLAVTMVTAIMIWHIGFHLLRSQLPQQGKWQTPALLALFGVAIFTLQTRMKTEFYILELTRWLMNVRLPSEFLLVFVMWWLARKERSS